MAEVESLTYDLVFDWQKKAFKDFDKQMANIAVGFAKVSAVIATVQALAFGLAKKTADTNDQLAKQARRLNTTTSEYQKLSFVVNDFGASTDDLTSSLANLTKAQEDVLRGQGDLEAFGQLGINPSDFQTSSDLLLAISDSISTIEKDSTKIRLLERIGVSKNLLESLEGGSDVIRQLGTRFEKLGATITKEQKKVAGDFQSVWHTATTLVEGRIGKIGTELQKVYIPMIKKFNKFLEDNLEKITSGFMKFFNFITKVGRVLFGVLERVVGLFNDMVDVMGSTENAVLALGVIFVALKAKMLFAFAIPLIVIGAVLIALQDIVSFFKGKDSLFGDFFGFFGVEADHMLWFFRQLKKHLDIIIETVGLLVLALSVKKFPLLTALITVASVLKGALAQWKAFKNPSGIEIQKGSPSLVPDNPITPFFGKESGSNNNNQITINVQGGNAKETAIEVKKVVNEMFISTVNSFSFSTL